MRAAKCGHFAGRGLLLLDRNSPSGPSSHVAEPCSPQMGRIISFIASLSLAIIVLWSCLAERDGPEQHELGRNRLVVRRAKDYVAESVGGQAQLSILDADITPALTTTVLRTRPTTVYKPRSLETFMHSRFSLEDGNVEWNEVEVSGPDIEDRHTLQQLAMMSADAYGLPGQKNWYDLDEAWNQVRRPPGL